MADSKVAIRMAFPMRAILQRLGAAEKSCWEKYLPRGLEGIQLSISPTPSPTQEPSISPASSPTHTGSDATPTEYQSIDAAVSGMMLKLSRQRQGCRQVQHALDVAKEGKDVVALVSELHGHIWETMRCPNGNHVLQKCIPMMKPQDLQFMLDELMLRNVPTQASCHKYGCRIVQGLLQHCDADQTRPLVNAIITCASHIACHPFGNYVVQHLLANADLERSRSLRDVLQKNIRALASDPFGRAVLSKAVCVMRLDDKLALASSLVQESDLWVEVACSRLGHSAAFTALELLQDPEREKALDVLLLNQEKLLSSCPGYLWAEKLGLVKASATASAGLISRLT